MRTRSRFIVLANLVALPLMSLNVTADRLEFPNWSDLFRPNGASAMTPTPAVRTTAIQETISAGRGIDQTARQPRLVEVEVDGSTTTRRVYLENVMRPLRIHPRHDLGNVYAYVREGRVGLEHVYVAAERLRHSTGTTTVEFELNREEPVYSVNRVVTRIGGRELAGDLKARVTFRNGSPTQFLLRRRISGEWRVAGNYRFNARGCAGTYALAVACIKEMANGSYINTPPAHTANGSVVRVPEVNELVEVGFNIPRLVNRNGQLTTLSVRTPQDIAVGKINNNSATEDVRFSRLEQFDTSPTQNSQ